MPYVYRTMIVPAELVNAARQLTDNFGPSSQNMFSSPYARLGSVVPTHYVSAGQIEQEFADMMDSPEALVDGAALYGITVDLDTATALLQRSTITAEDASTVLPNMGLQPFAVLAANRDDTLKVQLPDPTK